MDFRENVSLDSSQVINAGGSGGGGGRGGGVAIGGGLGLILAILGMVFGFNPGDILGTQTAGTPQSGTQAGAAPNECNNTNDVAKNRECRWTLYVNSIQAYWASQFPEGKYVKAPTVTFRGQINTGCGAADSQVGPFYCPSDKRVYIDTAFADQLLQQLGAQGGDAAEAYILAHEYGHHISNLTGQLGKAQSAGNQTGPDSPQVRLELQADCYAGVWFKNASSGQDAVISGITEDDLVRVADAAEAVGDDRIQESQAGRVSPESWTHGSAAMRHYWVGRGFQSGDPNVCSETFTTNNLEGR